MTYRGLPDSTWSPSLIPLRPRLWAKRFDARWAPLKGNLEWRLEARDPTQQGCETGMTSCKLQLMLVDDGWFSGLVEVRITIAGSCTPAELSWLMNMVLYCCQAQLMHLISSSYNSRNMPQQSMSVFPSGCVDEVRFTWGQALCRNFRALNAEKMAGPSAIPSSWNWWLMIGDSIGLGLLI